MFSHYRIKNRSIILGRAIFYFNFLKIYHLLPQFLK